MTPQLQQAIKLLQLTNIELQQYLEEQTAENPFLDVSEEKKEVSETEKMTNENESKEKNDNETIDFQGNTDFLMTQQKTKIMRIDSIVPILNYLLLKIHPQTVLKIGML